MKQCEEGNFSEREVHSVEVAVGDRSPQRAGKHCSREKVSHPLSWAISQIYNISKTKKKELKGTIELTTVT